MYQTDFICTYKLMEDEFSRNQLYRIQVVQAFNLEVCDEDIINKIIKSLYTQFEQLERFRTIVETAMTNTLLIEIFEAFDVNDKNTNKASYKKEFFFTLLFNYEHFDLLHRCICEQLNKGEIMNGTYEKMINKLLQKE
jgi:hypothetical protein